MATTTTTIGASDLMRILQSQVQDTVYYHGEQGVHLMNLFPVGPVTGGDTFSFPAKVNANGSFATFSEGDDPGAASQGTTLRATAAWTYFRTIAEITGHTDDAAQGTQLGPTLVQNEMNDAMRALMAGVKVAFLANSTIGLVGLIDDATTAWHSLSRTTYPSLVSYVGAGGSTTLAASVLNTAREVIRDAPFVLQESVLLSRPNIKNDYLALAPQSASGGTTPVNVNRADVSGTRQIDLGWNFDGVRWDGSPWLHMPELAATVIMGLDLSPGNFEYVPHRDWNVKEFGMVRDSRIFQFSHAGALIAYKPRKSWKIEALT